MMKWTIERERPVGASPGRDTDAAFVLRLTMRGGQNFNTTVEYAAGIGDRLPIEPREAIRPYLDNEVPPRRLIVDRQGNVRAEDE